MSYVALFFAGALLCNSIPHLGSGLQGRPFPTPFAQPHGVGDSSPFVNFLWGFANFLAGMLLLSRHPVEMGLNASLLTVVIGALAIGTFTSFHFGRVQAQRLALKSAAAPHLATPPRSAP